MRRCSPIPPVVPPVSRFPRCAKPRKSVITVNGLSPDADGNVNAGDVRREDFSGVKPKDKMTLNEVGAKVNEVIGRLGGTADAAAASPSASGYGPGTHLGDVHPDTALSDVVEAAGMSADAVRAIASEVVSPIKTSVTSLQEAKLDRSDVVDPAVATEAGKAADAKKTQDELTRILGVASGAMALAESKADKSALTAHTENTNNPHKVTAEQVGALSISRANTGDTFDWNPSGGGIRLFGTYYGTGIGLSTWSGGGQLFNYHDGTEDWYKLPTGESGTLALKDDISALESSKANRPALPVTNGNLASLTSDGNLADSGIDGLGIARMYGNDLVVQPGGATTRVDASMLGYSASTSDTIKDRLDAKADKTIPSKLGNLSALAEDGNIIDSHIDMQDLALKNQVNYMADQDSGFVSGYGDGLRFELGDGEQRLAVLKGRVIVDRDGKDAGERSVAMLGDINSATRGKADRASLAPEYSATSAYSVGSIVYHDGNIYQCKTAIAEGGEAWNAAHWELRKLSDFFTNSNSLLTGTIDEEIIEKGTAPDAHLEAPTDEHLKLIRADNSVAYDSAKALPYKFKSVIGDRVIATMTLTAASTDITLPAIAANDTTVKDFILDVTNAYAVEGVATDAGINIPRTDFKLVTRDGESLTDVTTVKAGKSAFICFTQKSPVVVDGTTYPCWCVIQLPFGDPS